MKRFLIISFVSVSFFLGVAVVSPLHAFAGLCDQDPPLTGQTLQDCLASEAGANDTRTDTQIQAQDDAAIAAAQKAAAASATDAGKDETKGFGVVMTWIASLFAWLVGVAALTLDYSVYFTVVTMGDYVHKLSAVGVTWRILRDIGNIMLIFGFLAAGITTIINVDWYGGGKKMIPMLLVSAVFINFSLFFSEAVIDVGNLFATQFFTQINNGHQPTADFLQKTTIGSEGISNKIMAQVGLQTIYTNGSVKKDVFKAGNTWTIGFMAILLFIVTAFVMFSLAFMLIARFVILLFLIILAPVGFAGLAVPRLRGMATSWWHKLFEQTITAPVLLLLLYVALAVITDASFLTGLCVPTNSNTSCTANWLGYVDGNFQGFASMLLTFIVAMGLLLFVTIAAKSMSASGADASMKLAGKLSFGTSAWLGRTTVGWGANKGAKYLRKTWVARTPIIGTRLVKGLDKVAGGSFDIRGTGLLKKLPEGGVDAGVAQKGGYKADLKERTEARTKYASELTGRELSEEEKTRQAMLQKETKEHEDELKQLRIRQVQAGGAGRNAQIDNDIVGREMALKNTSRDLNKLESVTAKGAQRKYASVLELGQKPDGFFNKYVNFAANTDAAKKIREEAKKSSDDKTLDALKKALKKAGGEDDHAVPPAGAAAPAGGVAPAAPAGGGGGH